MSDARSWILAIGFLSISGPVSMATPVCADYLSFLKTDCTKWQSKILPTTLPPARGNAFAERDDAAALGMKIFYDNRFSKRGSGVSCASCHDPEHSFSEAKPRSRTLKEVARNAPDLIDAAWYARSHFWDGKTDNLWSVPLFTLEQEDEMGATRLQVVHVLASIYKMRYEKIFGELPDLSDTKRFPELGKPGTPEFDRMSDKDKTVVNQIYANVGKALEAYMRKLAAGPSPFDDFMAGSEKSLSPAARRGMVVFTAHACDICHSGSTFTDESFHNLGPSPVSERAGDLGREGGIRFAKTWQFSSTSRYADPPLPDKEPAAKAIASDKGAFRTASLRNVALTSPYGHDGTWETLGQAIDAHAKLMPARTAISAEEKNDLIEFLRSLSGRPPQRPWNYWPGG